MQGCQGARQGRVLKKNPNSSKLPFPLLQAVEVGGDGSPARREVVVGSLQAAESSDGSNLKWREVVVGPLQATKAGNDGNPMRREMVGGLTLGSKI